MTGTKTGLAALLRNYINPLVILSIFRLSNDTNKEPACFLKESYTSNPYVMEGDVVIGGVLKVSDSRLTPFCTFLNPPSEHVCYLSVLQYFRHLLAFMFAVEEINGQEEILPNITLGYILHDSCELERAALHQALCIISGRETMAPNYDCFQKGRLVGIVGHRYSSLSASIASVTGIYRYPQISYGSRDSVFNDDVNLPSFHRTFPGQRAQHDALIQLLKHFGWTWVGILSSVGDSSQRSSLELKERLTQNGICVEFLVTVENVFTRSNFKSKGDITHSTSHVLIFNHELDRTTLLSDITKKNDLRKVFIFLFNFPAKLNVNDMSELNGSLLFQLQRTEIPGLKSFLLDANPQKYPDLYVLRKIWVETFDCLPEGLERNHLREYMAGVCNESDNFHTLKSEAYDVDNFHLTFQVYGAVYALAYALHDLTTHRAQEHSVDSPSRWKPWKLNYYLKRIHLFTPGGEEIYFTKDGHFLTKFDILNYVSFENGSSQTNTVGYYRETTDGFQLEINDSAICWNPHFTQTPQSTCSKRCLLGYHRIPIKGHQKCCYTCVPCPEGQISNTTDMEKCITCLEDEWSNQDRKACVQRATEFLSHGDTLSLFLIVFSLLFCLLTAAILGIFIKYKDTAIVKANNQTLSFILLLSLLLSFLCPLLFIGHPSEMSCLLRQVAFGNIFTVAVSSVLAKTVTVVLAFRATKPDRTQRRWLGKNLAIYVLLLSSFGEFLICVFWLIISPPFPEYNTWVEVGKIILQCNEGSAIAFYVAIGYIGFLAVLSFIVAFLARNLPDTFNEAQYITFSMLVFCSVWISFIPAYLSTKGKYMVAVEVFAIVTSSAGLLSCIFIPKCYIILLRPEMNVRYMKRCPSVLRINGGMSDETSVSPEEALLARKLADTFNEAQYITFSMLVFCSVWISFIPAYLSTKWKYMVTMEVFSIEGT
ncbi:vomeronasal type-2 receptor 26-like [Dendropsophus ebraccatus]|uniref:vomeronasal type-2 receptor 26-like n=1 Tax=Dendropsophus ebraccatus TaxID=150705 RepID=UPI003831F5AF